MPEIKKQLYHILETTEWSQADRSWLLQYLESSNTSELQKLLHDEFSVNIGTGETLDNERAKQLLEFIHQEIIKTPGRVININLWKRIAAIAAVFFLFLTGAYFLLSDKPPAKIAQKQVEKQVPSDIRPGGNKAVLTLADNSIIVLDDAQNGTIASQGNTKILKLNDGRIAYNDLNEKPLQVLYNTITTPRGGQYQLTLSDGTKVWLNSTSSLRFPASFPSNERKVEITGEVYFEVAKLESAPFKVVVSDKAEVKVLGTHFNINSYPDELSINTTLLEGSVNITLLQGTNMNKKASLALLPGQQAQLSKNAGLILNEKPDLQEVMAWKNGKFYFGEATDIAAIMRQISRWYDIDVEIKGEINEHLGGSLPRDVNVSKIFNTLEKTGSVKFELTGRKVIVMPGKK